MNNPNFQAVVQQIMDHSDRTLTGLGAEIGLSKQGIIRLRDGEVREPRYSHAMRLLRIHRRIMGTPPPATP